MKGSQRGTNHGSTGGEFESVVIEPALHLKPLTVLEGHMLEE